MCRFCVEHGEGQRWYLNAANYAHDLESDVRRRDYVVGFIRNFERNRSSAITWMDRLDMLPVPLGRAGKSLLSKRMQVHHFGQPVPIEECAQILELATSITVIPCICRMHTPGKRAEEVCILVTTKPIDSHLAEGFAGYDDGPGLDDFNAISAQQAMRLLTECEERGLMHSIWTFQTPFTAAICNCNLESGCMAMKLTADYQMKMMWRGEWIVQMDEGACTACGKCARVCPFSAFDVARGNVTVAPERCWGCGICRSACRQGALSLVERATVPEVATLW